jgi:hypothetical protein
MNTPYYDLPGFDQVYLEDSFVTQLIETDGELSFLLDLVLREGHPRYAPPPPHEQYCFRLAKLTFAEPRRVVWEKKDFRPATDAGGAVSYGNIDLMDRLEDGTYRLVGEWGVVLIVADPPVITFIEGQ